MQASRLPEMYLITGVILLLASLHTEAHPQTRQSWMGYPEQPPDVPETETATPTTTTTTVPPLPPLPGTDKDAAVGGCVCPTTTQYDPVCGTDNQTYGNRELLRCAQRCGRDVQENFQGRCTSFVT